MLLLIDTVPTTDFSHVGVEMPYMLTPARHEPNTDVGPAPLLVLRYRRSGAIALLAPQSTGYFAAGGDPIRQLSRAAVRAADPHAGRVVMGDFLACSSALHCC